MRAPFVILPPLQAMCITPSAARFRKLSALAAIVVGSAIVGLVTLVAFVSNLPEELNLRGSARGLAALLLGCPLYIVLVCCIFSVPIMLAEGFSFWEAFQFTMGITCQMATPLTDANP